MFLRLVFDHAYRKSGQFVSWQYVPYERQKDLGSIHIGNSK